jgi:hypothetical protein
VIDIRLNEDNQKLHDKLLVSSADLTFARYCAGMLLKKGWHAQPWERRGTVYEQQVAFTSALVTAYGRPFTHSKGRPALPPDLIPSHDQEAALHRQIMQLRRQVYAHSDSARYSVKLVRIGDLPGTLISEPRAAAHRRGSNTVSD